VPASRSRDEIKYSATRVEAQFKASWDPGSIPGASTKMDHPTSSVVSPNKGETTYGNGDVSKSPPETTSNLNQHKTTTKTQRVSALFRHGDAAADLARLAELWPKLTVKFRASLVALAEGNA